MQIQSLGSSPAPKLDERPAAVTGQAAVAGRTPVADAPASVPDVAPGREEVSAAVKKLNESMPPSAQSLEFEIDEESKEVVVKIIDQSTREVVRQMPSKEALEMAKAIDKLQGLLIRQTA
ncbi:flagellar protein FlaG [Telluria beijingensis]|uniref:flagellar protein FlaG n=1 Tax=Telluria beijingensis TaxID=3068633 RepID=UPI0027958DE5|nr:flagellar protein FlaG [Massilia sp. REN29]